VVFTITRARGSRKTPPFSSRPQASDPLWMRFTNTMQMRVQIDRYIFYIGVVCLSTAIEDSYTKVAACQPAHHMQTPMRANFATSLSNAE
jgi:hypothetical protein